MALLVCLSADPSSTGIRLRQANFQEDFLEKNPGYVLGARGRCGDMRRKGGRRDVIDELHGAGTFKGILHKKVSLFLVELCPGEVCRDTGGSVP